jgi:hypothetical protein
VRRIAVTLGEQQFELDRADERVRCTRHSVVRGITLNRREMSMADWIEELNAAVARSAEVSEQDRLALGRLLA